MTPITTLRIHRFHDQVAFDTDCSTQTQYLNPKMAKKLAYQLSKYAKDCEQNKYSQSSLTTKEIN